MVVWDGLDTDQEPSPSPGPSDEHARLSEAGAMGQAVLLRSPTMRVLFGFLWLVLESRRRHHQDHLSTEIRSQTPNFSKVPMPYLESARFPNALQSPCQGHDARARFRGPGLSLQSINFVDSLSIR